MKRKTRSFFHTKHLDEKTNEIAVELSEVDERFFAEAVQRRRLEKSGQVQTNELLTRAD